VSASTSQSGPVEVIDYDQRWPARFEAYADELRRALGSVAARVEHIGSTAVPGLAAKAVIDIQVSVGDVAAIDLYKPGMESIGLAHRPHPEEPERREFFRPPGRRIVHVHVVGSGSAEERRHLLHRDYLRAHPAASREYGELKRRLAETFRDARQNYQEAKSPFLQSMGLEAERWARETSWQPRS